MPKISTRVVCVLMVRLPPPPPPLALTVHPVEFRYSDNARIFYNYSCSSSEWSHWNTPSTSRELSCKIRDVWNQQGLCQCFKLLHRCSQWVITLDNFAALETNRKLGRVNFGKDFWDCYKRQGKNWPIADQRDSSDNPETQLGDASCRPQFSSRF